MICEHFPGLSPTQVIWELENDPEQWLLKIVEVRAYQKARAKVAETKDGTELPKDGLTEAAIDNRLERGHAEMLRRLAERKAQGAKTSV